MVVGRTERGWASRFGELRGIDGVPQTTPPRGAALRLGFVADDRQPRSATTRSTTALNLGGRVGADMKVGIGSNLTLEATINPDFGQIEADPAEVNLTVFETIFDERRPFFIEGNSVLEAGTSQLLLLAPHRRAADRPGDRRLRRLSVDATRSSAPRS